MLPAILPQPERTMALPKSLKEGYRRFLRDRHAPDRGRYIQLSELGQAPTAMVIACCDARIDVSAIFDVEAGELFILRNVANLVPNYEPDGKHHGTSAAIEFAVQELKVPHLIVLGHSHCGGIEAYRQKVRNKVPERGFLGSWLTLLDGLEDRRKRRLHLWRRDGLRARRGQVVAREAARLPLRAQAGGGRTARAARLAFRPGEREPARA